MDTYEQNNILQSETQPQPVLSEQHDQADWNILKEPVAENTIQLPVCPAPSNVPKKKKKGVWKVLLAVLLAAVILVTSCCATAVFVSTYWEQRLDVTRQAMNNKLAVMQEKLDDLKASGVGAAPSDDELLTPSQVYAQNAKAVVAISSWKVSTDVFGQTSQGQSTGSGFIITDSGYVVTNYHVVENGTSFTVVTEDGQEHPARLVGYESSNDICLLKMEGEGFPHVKLGSSDRMAVGDQVVAIGSPLGELTSTLTVGYISAKDRIITTDGSSQSMLQTDAAINSGNSGGPLFNMLGEVIGITTAKYSGTSNSGASIESIGFAIPISDVEPMISDLMNYGYIKMAYLGVSVQDVPAESQYYGLPAGSYVISVVENGAADRAGVRAKDIIVNIGGYKVRNLSELSRVLQKLEAGEETTITVYRSGKEVDLAIVMGEKPNT